MSQHQEQIAQFRKMASADPENDLGHYRLGQLLLEDGQYGEAIESLRRTLEINPQFAKAYQLLAQALIANNQRPEAIAVLNLGYGVADEHGHNMPRDEMARMLVELGQPRPESRRPAESEAPAGVGGFRCRRPGCLSGSHAHQLPRAPFNDDIGQRIYETVCTDCWNEWFRHYSIKVINELHLDLSSERGQQEYDRYMREFLGIE
jgi:Fe-S cluster biosynthesis and repair protein YggX